MPASLRAARVLGVLSCVLGLVLAAAPDAHAASRTVQDATEDVYTLSDQTPTKAPGADGDIVSVTTVHGPRQVRITVRARHLSLDQTLLFAKIRTAPTGPAYLFNGTADIGMRMAIMTRGQAQVVVCPGLWMRFHPARSVATAVIPRRCLGNPRWVQTGAALVTTPSMVASLADPEHDPFADDGADLGTIDIAGLGTVTAGHLAAAAPPLPLGPRVHVG